MLLLLVLFQILVAATWNPASRLLAVYETEAKERYSIGAILGVLRTQLFKEPVSPGVQIFKWPRKINEPKIVSIYVSVAQKGQVYIAEAWKWRTLPTPPARRGPMPNRSQQHRRLEIGPHRRQRGLSHQLIHLG